MRKLLCASTIFMLITAALLTSAAAQDERQLDWADLVEKVEFEDPFEALTPDQLGDLGQVARIRGLQGAQREAGESLSKELLEATRRLEAAGIDIDGLLARREEIRELREQRAYSVVDDLNGQQVRLPGYALPLEISGVRVTEFLLVPWVGACIHTPPPPPQSDRLCQVRSRHRNPESLFSRLGQW